MAIKIELGQRYEVVLHEKRFTGRVTALPTESAGAKVRLDVTECTFEIPVTDFLTAMPTREVAAAAVAQQAAEAIGRSPAEPGTARLAKAIADPSAQLPAHTVSIFLDGPVWCAAGIGPKVGQESQRGFADNPADAMLRLFCETGMDGSPIAEAFRASMCERDWSIRDDGANQIVGILRKGVPVHSPDDEECGSGGHEIGTVQLVEEHGDPEVGIPDSSWYELRLKKPRAVLLEQLASAVRAAEPHDDESIANLIEAASAVVNAGLKV